MTPQRWRWLAVGAAVFVAYLAGSIGGVVGTSGVIATSGAGSALVLWAFEAILSLVAATVLLKIIDRTDRVRLARGIMSLGAVTMLSSAALLAALPPGPILFAIVALADRLNFALLCYAVWSLAWDTHGSDLGSLAKLHVVCMAAQIVGASSAGAAATRGIPRAALFAAVGVLFVLTGRVLAMCQGGMKAAAPTGSRSEPPEAPVFASLRPGSLPPGGPGEVRVEGWAGLRRAIRHLGESRRVRGVALLGLLNGIAYTVLAYQLARLLEAEKLHDVDHVQTRYGLLRALEPAAFAAAELWLAPALVRRLGFSPVMLATPVALLLSLAALAAAPVASVGMTASAAVHASFAVEGLALAAALGSVPKGDRGRVGLLLDSTPYSVGYVLSIVGLGGMLLGERSGGLGGWQSRSAGLGLGALAAAAGIVTAARLVVVERRGGPRRRWD